MLSKAVIYKNGNGKIEIPKMEMGGGLRWVVSVCKGVIPEISGNIHPFLFIWQ